MVGLPRVSEEIRMPGIEPVMWLALAFYLLVVVVIWLDKIPLSLRFSPVSWTSPSVCSHHVSPLQLCGSRLLTCIVQPATVRVHPGKRDVTACFFQGPGTRDFLFFFFLESFCYRCVCLREKQRQKARNHPQGRWPRCNSISSFLSGFWAGMHTCLAF